MTAQASIPSEMKVGVYHKNSDVRIETRPVPGIGPGEILVRVKASGICGTDAMEWYRTKKGPRVLGHEIAGDIAAAAPDVAAYNPGDRVFVSHHVPCNTCKHCMNGNHTACETLHTGNYDPGGFAEYVRVPAINVTNGTYKLPDGVTYLEGSMIEPLACGVRGQRVAGVRAGQTVLILGCGISGLLNVMLAKLAGARVVATDLDEYRLDKARQYGADAAVHASQSPDVKADVAIVCAGSQRAFDTAFANLDRKGVVLFFAIPPTDVTLPTENFWRNEWSAISSYGAAPDDLSESLEIIIAKKLDIESLITHTMPMDDIQKGFDLVSSPGQSLKVVLLP